MKLRCLLLLAALLATNAARGNDLFEKGKEVNGPCAGCHGEFGQGGKRGEYPRIGGQRAAHIEEQLRAFRDRKRMNMPMFPYTQERELPEEDIKAVAAYLESIVLPTRYPDFKDSDDALTRLTLMEKVMIVPRAPGDVDNGKSLYQKECSSCHGKTGMGRAEFPRLVGQYTEYLKRQIDAFLAGERPHDEAGVRGILNNLKAQEIGDILAYLTSIQEQE